MERLSIGAERVGELALHADRKMGSGGGGGWGGRVGETKDKHLPGLSSVGAPNKRSLSA